MLLLFFPPTPDDEPVEVDRPRDFETQPRWGWHRQTKSGSWTAGTYAGGANWARQAKGSRWGEPRSFTPPSAPEPDEPGLEALAESDFANGTYSWDGESKTFEETWRDSFDVSGEVPVVIVPGVGIITTSADFTGVTATAEFFASLGVADGISFVFDYTASRTGSRNCNVGVFADNYFDYTEGWGFQASTASPSALVEDYARAPVSDTANAVNGVNRAACTWLPTGLSFSVNGGAVQTLSSPQDISASVVGLYIDMSVGASGTGTATAICEKIAFYEPQDLSALPGLSTQA